MRCWPSSERTTNPSSHRKRQDSLSLSLVLFPPKLLRWVSAGALFGEVIKLPFCIFSAFLCGGGITTLGPLWLCRNNPARGLFQQKKRLSQSGCSAPTNALFSPEHSAFLVPLCGVVSLPSACASCCWNAGRAGVTAAYLPFLCRPGIRPVRAEYPLSGYTRPPSPNRAHSGSHAETRRVLRVDGDDVLGSGIIDTIDPFQADQTVAVALAEGHRNAVSP